MKPFNLEQAKAGKPVCTRDGMAARIICFDAKSGDFPIIALITDEDGDEAPETYTVDGSYYKNTGTRGTDLMMDTQERIGWVNLYHIEGSQGVATSQCALYDTKELALLRINQRNGDYIGTYPITYED